MKHLTILLLLATCACHGQQAKMANGTTRQTISIFDASGKSREVPLRPMVTGAACYVDHNDIPGNSDGDSWGTGSYSWETMYDAKLGFSWSHPSDQYWGCIANKWVRNLQAEKARDEHLSFVNSVRDALSRRKLTDAEFAVMREINFSAAQTTFTCSGHGCFEAIECQHQQQRTADLIAQVGFYNPTEEDLPLKFLKSYVKGMTCDAGIGRAYEIMNERIMEYLKKQHQ